MLELKPERVHADEGDQHAERQRDDGDERAAHMQQEDEADERDDQAFLDQRALERVDGAVDQIGAVIDRHRSRRLRGRLGAISASRVLDVVDHGERVLRRSAAGDAGDDLALAVELGDAAPLVGRQLDARDVLEQHRRAALALDARSARGRRCS